VKSNDVCKTVPACKTDGACSAVHGRGSLVHCEASNAADCEQSDACKYDGRCKWLGGGCQKP
jgi:hypothetical protein